MAEDNVVLFSRDGTTFTRNTETEEFTIRIQNSTSLPHIEGYVQLVDMMNVAHALHLEISGKVTTNTVKFIADFSGATNKFPVYLTIRNTATKVIDIIGSFRKVRVSGSSIMYLSIEGFVKSLEIGSGSHIDNLEIRSSDADRKDLDISIYRSYVRNLDVEHYGQVDIEVEDSYIQFYGGEPVDTSKFLGGTIHVFKDIDLATHPMFSCSIRDLEEMKQELLDISKDKERGNE